jgi:hypothetical protein
MSTDGTPLVALKASVKSAVALAKESRWDEFYDVYTELFRSPAFADNRADDQRQALKLMIGTKGLPAPSTPQGVGAYQAAWYVLTRLVADEKRPTDYELLGLVHLRLGDEPGAKQVFQSGLEAAQAANDGDTCGVFLRHLANF